MTPSRPASKHSDEDARATQVGAPGQPDYTFYTYDAHGNVATRIVGGTTHTYTWDGEGSLLGVAGTTPGPITYDVDAKGRRVGKRVNGTLERQWMYDGQLRIVAEVVYAPVVRYRVYGYMPERHLPVLMLFLLQGDGGSVQAKLLWWLPVNRTLHETLDTILGRSIRVAASVDGRLVQLQVLPPLTGVTIGASSADAILRLSTWEGPSLELVTGGGDPSLNLRPGMWVHMCHDSGENRMRATFEELLLRGVRMPLPIRVSKLSILVAPKTLVFVHYDASADVTK